jgi:hypothetical protein
VSRGYLSDSCVHAMKPTRFDLAAFECGLATAFLARVRRTQQTSRRVDAELLLVLGRFRIGPDLLRRPSHRRDDRIRAECGSRHRPMHCNAAANNRVEAKADPQRGETHAVGDDRYSRGGPTSERCFAGRAIATRLPRLQAPHAAQAVALAGGRSVGGGRVAETISLSRRGRQTC